jgi:hypothetical protein
MARLVATLATVALVATTWVRLAGAQDSARAEESFQAGRTLLNEGRYGEACPKFEQSQREDPASGTLLALAYCEELAGKLATAYRHYKAAAELAEREGQADRKSAAAERVAALAQRLSVLTLVVPPEISALDGLKIVRNGVELERALLGTDMPVDGGTYKVEVSAPGRVTWSATVTLETEKDKKTLIIQLLEPLAPNEVPKPKSLAAASPPEPTPRPLPPPPPQADDGSARTLEYASLALAVGSVASFSIGIAFGLMAESDNDASNADGHCDSRGCDERGMELRNDALSSARISTWSCVTGGALALGSLAIYIGAKNSGPKVNARVIPGGAGISLTEAF